MHLILKERWLGRLLSPFILKRHKIRNTLSLDTAANGADLQGTAAKSAEGDVLREYKHLMGSDSSLEKQDQNRNIPSAANASSPTQSLHLKEKHRDLKRTPIQAMMGTHLADPSQMTLGTLTPTQRLASLP